MEMTTNFLVDQKPVGTGFREVWNVAIRIFDHEVAVERQTGGFANGGEDWRAKCDVGDEMAVHDGDVANCAAASFGGGDFLTKPGEIGGKDAEGEVNHRGSVSIGRR